MPPSSRPGGAGDHAPVALFVYDRPEHTRRALEALSKNDGAGNSKLCIFSDGPKAGAGDACRQRIHAVRKLIREEPWCGEVRIVESDANLGLARSVRAGVNQVLEESDRVIVLEDDLVTSPGFLNYMNAALARYQSAPEVMSVSGYVPASSYQWMLPETFFLRHMSCWGWATWRDSWRQGRWDAGSLLSDLENSRGGTPRFDMEGACAFTEQLVRNQKGEIETWAIFWSATIYLQGGLCLHPGRSLVQNIGTDGSGTNFSIDQRDRFFTDLARSIRVAQRPLRESRVGRWYLKSFNRYGRDARFSTRIRRNAGILKHRLALRFGLL